MIAICFLGFFVVAFLMCQAGGSFGPILGVIMFVILGAQFGFGVVAVAVVAALAVASYIEHRLKARERP